MHNRKLEYFMQFRESIKRQVLENSENSIQNIMQSLARNDSIYRTFNEGLRLARIYDTQRQLPNSLVEYIHDAHVRYVTIALRKLYDKKKEGSSSVNSIRTISEQISNNAHLVTRLNYLTYDGTPYELSRGLDFRVRMTVNGRHAQFDQLCGLRSGARRKPNDRLHQNIVESLINHAVLRKDLKDFANKFVVHAAAKNNRPDEKKTFGNVTFNRIQSQYKNAIWAIQLIGKILDEAILTKVPVPTFDMLTNWEHGLFTPNIKRKLRRYWDSRMNWWSRQYDHYRDSQRLYLSPNKEFANSSVGRA